ncbi:peptidase [candidate division KSB1 bacterium]|nr:MAG: peptidase [candidate division KSB1 bacterium]
MRVKITPYAALIIIFLIAGCAKKIITKKSEITYVQNQINKLAEVNLTADFSYMPAEEIQVIKLIVQASKVLDDIFLDQVYSLNRDIRKELVNSGTPEDKEYLKLFDIMFGPWNRLDHDKPFINTVEKPAGANFYPEDMTKKEFLKWLKDHPETKDAFESNFTVIRRKGDKLAAIPYSEYYKKELTKAADFLKQAAQLTSDQSLRTFLLSRADSFLSNDYFQSDMDWMDLNGDIETVIGPYEVYEDNLFGYKAAFEAFVCIVDKEESKKLQVIGSLLNQMEANLPLADKYKNFERGSSSPIKVVNEIFTAGDTKAGVQTLAFNLPNDERVRKAKGSKKVLLKNVMHAKFDKILIPIVERTLTKKTMKKVSFDAYFNHILMHEVSHGLGPGEITVNGKNTTVNKELKDLYSTIEECKADVLGMFNCQFLIDKGIFPKSLEKTLYATNLGGMFRSIRFGIGEAHGGGTAIQMNFYLEKGAYKISRDGKFYVNEFKIKSAVKQLAKKVLLIEATGDYKAAKELIEKYAVIKPEVQKALDSLNDIPVDIHPVYPIEKEL